MPSESEPDPAARRPDIAILLTGGRSSRMGRHKPALPIDGVAIADHTIHAVRTANPEALIVIAGTDQGLHSPDLITVPDTETFAGPLAGIASAVAWLHERAATDAAGSATHAFVKDDEAVCILAGDMPYLSAASLQQLCDRATLTAPACAVDSTGRMQFLVSAWRWPLLMTQLASITEVRNAPVKRLFAGVRPTLVAIPDAELRDIDTPEDYPGT